MCEDAYDLKVPFEYRFSGAEPMKQLHEEAPTFSVSGSFTRALRWSVSNFMRQHVLAFVVLDCHDDGGRINEADFRMHRF